jgi:K+/H+ antiporter YhaU regulatory subunit KhtT
MILLQNTEINKKIELTDDEIEAIHCAMGDYQDYGDEEQEIASSIRDKLFLIFEL